MMLTAAIALGATLTGFGETVTNVRGAQRPNSNLVDIYYDLNASDGGTYTVEVAIEGRTDVVTATTFSGDVGKGIAPGKNHHIVWEAGADWRGKKGDVKAIVTATVEARKGKPKKVQLWEGGPYWADRNIGADNPWDYGLYFWWGDTEGHRPTADGTFSFNCWVDNSAIFTCGKGGNELLSAGWLTSNFVLAPSHDAAHVKWGGGWRMPTEGELDELNKKCDWTWVTQNGVNGCVVCGRGDYSSASIFLPAAGFGQQTRLSAGGSFGLYWSSDAAGDLYDQAAEGLMLNRIDWNFSHYKSGSGRYNAASIRPVQ